MNESFISNQARAWALFNVMFESKVRYESTSNKQINPTSGHWAFGSKNALPICYENYHFTLELESPSSQTTLTLYPYKLDAAFVTF